MRNYIHLGIIAILVIFALLNSIEPEQVPQEIQEDNVEIILDVVPFTKEDLLELELTPENLLTAMKLYDIEHPEIVLAQALLETGYFTSNICKKDKNLFGLYNSRTKKFYKFKHWSLSVEAYKKYIQRRLKEDEPYFKFLTRIGYAEDPLYNSKLKKIMNSSSFNYNID